MGQDTKFKYQELTGKIIGCAMEVHNELGFGFPEIFYHRALAIELDFNNIPYEQEVHLPIHYKKNYIGRRVPDFLIEKKLIVEIKAVMHFEDSALVQALNYLEAFNLENGLLLNFGSNKLEIKRLLNRKFKSK